MLKNFESINTMGVINMTPNSFSDQKKFLDTDTLKKTLNHYKNKNLIFDFGFESTAPMNSAISKDLERERFDLFFDAISDVDLSGCWISFDTYRPQNYQYFEERFKSRYLDLGFIFNDVSGVIDDELLELLKKKATDKNFFYLYSNTHIPFRDKVLDHMKYLSNDEVVSTTIKKFKDAFKIFKEIGIDKKIILDPCFGFSKTFEQNWELINRFDEVVKGLDFEVPWLIGVSKKSFLRKMVGEVTDPFAESEILHKKIIEDLKEKNLGHLIFRVHNFDIVSSYTRKVE